jgi:hypothetical protein
MGPEAKTGSLTAGLRLQKRPSPVRRRRRAGKGEKRAGSVPAKRG